jgi:hypothetical protein
MLFRERNPHVRKNEVTPFTVHPEGAAPAELIEGSFDGNPSLYFDSQEVVIPINLSTFQIFATRKDDYESYHGHPLDRDQCAIRTGKFPLASRL